LTRGELSATGILNAVAPHLRGSAYPAAGVLVLTSLPFRLLEIHFVDLLMRLKGQAPHYGNLLTAVSGLTVAAFVVSLYGRAVFIRACQNPARSWRELLKVDGRAFAAYVYVALLIQLALVLTSITVIVLPVAVMLGGVAAAASVDKPRLGVIDPLRALGPYLLHGRVLAGIMFVFAIAYVVVGINLTFLARLIVWAAGAVPAFDSVKWNVILKQSDRFDLALLAASVAVLEPFFLVAMHVYADRVRSRESGDDLLRRFRALTAQKAIAAAVLIAVILCVPAKAQERTIATAEYVARLTTVRDDLAAGRFPEAAAAAADLDAVTSISQGTSRFEPDHALLRSAGEAAGKSIRDVVVIDRLSSTIDALSGGDLKSWPGYGDRKLLDQIRLREKAGELMRGGEVKEIPSAPPTITDEIARIFQNVIDWLAEKLETLFDWISSLWPKPREHEEGQSFLGVPVVVWVVTLLIVATVLLLATYVIRRSKRRAAAAVSRRVAASPAERDADPLSRESNEWERYAAELTAAGRLREAIRAWYHAVLMTLYRSGILHYRKGVTNWEYVRTLSPALAWRPVFISITRLFDREWYGHRETTPEALDSCAAEAREILVAVRDGGR
jgi:uncharacterized protein DUF4129